ncbi:MAG: hypothetical protein ACPLPR_05610 [Bacillota bacterium]
MANEKNLHSKAVTILFSPSGKEKVRTAKGKFRGVNTGHCLASILQVCFAWYRARASGKSSEEPVAELLTWEAGEGKKALPMPLVACQAKAPMLLSIMEAWLSRLAVLESKGRLKGKVARSVLASELAWDESLEHSGNPAWDAVKAGWARCGVTPFPHWGSWWWEVTGEDALDVAAAEVVLMIMHRVSLHSRPRVCPKCYTVYWARKRQGKWDVSCPKCSPHATPEEKALQKFRARLRQAKRPRSKRGPILTEAGYASLLRVARERGVAVAEKLYALVVEHGDIPGPGWEAVLSALQASGINEAEKRFMQFAGFSAPASNTENESIKAPCPREREKQP